MDVVLRILRLEEQQLGDDQVGDLIVDGRAEEDDAVLEQARVDVVGALAPPGLFDDDGDKTHDTSVPFASREDSSQFPLHQQRSISRHRESLPG